MTSLRAESPTAISNSSTADQARLRRILFIFGTRPEAIKLCPLVAELRSAGAAHFDPLVCVTGQHREMLSQVLTTFDIRPHYSLDVMTSGQTLNGLSARLLAGIAPVLEHARPAMTIVQGDTTSTLCGALASFHQRIPVAHVEAGLRTSDLSSPFPEEMNRVLTDRLSSLHFAATEWAADNLRKEGFDPAAIWVTGNTGIDAVLSTRDALERGELSGLSLPVPDTKRIVLVTAHRRESFGEGVAELCGAVAELAERNDVQVVWPVHPNPNVAGVAKNAFARHPNVLLLEPLDYLPFVDLMRRSYFLMTDSGGIQEEAPSLGKPVLVLREKTERPEAVLAGTVKLVGTNRERILAAASTLLDNPDEYRRMSRLHNPYGDGQASKRIVGHIAAYFADK